MGMGLSSRITAVTFRSRRAGRTDRSFRSRCRQHRRSRPQRLPLRHRATAPPACCGCV
jgi:hypothetical protein